LGRRQCKKKNKEQKKEFANHFVEFLGETLPLASGKGKDVAQVKER